jgi:hypothetical protein
MIRRDRVGAGGTVPNMRHVVLSERPDVEVCIDGEWWPGELRMWTQRADGSWWAAGDLATRRLV